jgi:AcrR family transcriptional regulator
MTQNPKRISLSAEADKKRDQIIDAATKLFAQHGFHGTGMRDLCESVSLSAGAFYRYFRSKEEIITTLIDRDRARTKHWFDEVPETLSLMDALTMLARTVVESIEKAEYLPIWTEIQAEAARNPKVRALVLAHSLEAEERFRQLIEQAVQKRSIASDVVAKDAARLILLHFDGLMVRRSYDLEFDFAKGARSCLRFIALALGAPQPSLRLFS